ncbi:MAG: hypothetical protein AAFQ61_09385 [Cyanobacteria bacterium J06626_23]
MPSFRSVTSASVWTKPLSGALILAAAAGSAVMAQPLPEQVGLDLLTTFTPSGNQVTIEFSNDTGAPLTYEVLGVTDQRLLPPQQSVSLQNIPLDATITAVRSDNGLIDITASSSEAGQLEISIIREVNFDDTQGVITIERSGRVFAY